MQKLLTRKYFPYLLILPSLILFASMFVYPVLNSFWLSLHIIRGESSRWGGAHNYIRLINDPMWWTSIINMIEILIFQVPLMLLLAMLLAIGLNSQLIKFKSFFRVSFFLPAVTSLVAYSIVFSMLLDNKGIINGLLGLFGIDPISWLMNPWGAKVSLIISVTWRWVGYNMVIYLAALQDIPVNLYEAATLDGASKFQQFKNITLPLLKPSILFTLVLSTLGTIQLFDEPFNLTKGGPADSTLSPTFLLYRVFSSFEIGYSSAIAYGIVLIVGFIALLQFKFLGSKD